ncbi:MAG: hypothetical protein AB7V27_03820 [Candidatus Binatia bacterium]
MRLRLGFVATPRAAEHQTIVPPRHLQRGAIQYTPLASAAPVQDFSAFVFGDCTGNWLPE